MEGCNWYTNLKLPETRGGGYKMVGELNNKNSNNPYDYGYPSINNRKTYKRYVIIKTRTEIRRAN